MEFVRPNWWPADIKLDQQKCRNYYDAAQYAHKRYKTKQEFIGRKLNERVNIKTVDQVRPGDILEGSRAAVTGAAVGAVGATFAGAGAAGIGAEKGAELGLLGGPIGVAAGAAAGALVGFGAYLVYKRATRPSYNIQVDLYTDEAAANVIDPSPNNLFNEVVQRNIERGRPPAPRHELGEDARQWYYYARLGKYCHLMRRDLVDPYDHELAARRAHEIATMCHANVGRFEWPQ